MSICCVLSIGSTRSLWSEIETDDTKYRLLYYSKQIDKYIVIANSYKKHKLKSKAINDNFEAIPTDAFSPLDSFIKILLIGKKVFKKNNISLIQAQDTLLLGVAAVILGKWFKKPVNVCVYGPNVFDTYWQRASWINLIMAPLGRWVLFNSSSIQVDGKMTSHSLQTQGIPAECIYIKPMIPNNINSFFQIERNQISLEQPVSLLFIGRLEKQENLTMLADVFKIISSYFCNKIELKIVGEGSEKYLLRKRLQRNKIEKNVRFLGWIHHSEITKVFAESEIFVLTSLYEGYPRVLMEAAASGMPTVATAVSGSDESIIDGKTGYIIPINDINAFADKVAYLIRNPV